jgi:hypothetical protein
VELAGEELPLQIALAHKGASFELQAEPWAIAYAKGIATGRTPTLLKLGEEPVTVVLRRPGVDQPVQLGLTLVP